MDITHKGTRFILPLSTISAAKELAKSSYLKYRTFNNKVSPYSQNTEQSHIIGKIGECGTAHALRTCGFEIKEIFNESDDSKCDIEINGVRIEIKCWTPKVYGQFGACITEKQAPKIIKKADIVLYCTFDEVFNVLTLRGWNYTSEIKNTTPKATGKISILNRKMHERKLTTTQEFKEFTIVLQNEFHVELKKPA